MRTPFTAAIFAVLLLPVVAEASPERVVLTLTPHNGGPKARATLVRRRAPGSVAHYWFRSGRIRQHQPLAVDSLIDNAADFTASVIGLPDHALLSITVEPGTLSGHRLFVAAQTWPSSIRPGELVLGLHGSLSPQDAISVFSASSALTDSERDALNTSRLKLSPILGMQRLRLPLDRLGRRFVADDFLIEAAYHSALP